MQDFLRDAAAKLGIGQDQAAKATGGILDLVKQHAGKADFGALLEKVPGASNLVGSSGGGGGGLMGALGGMLGGDAGKALGAADLVAKSGLDLSKLGGLLELLKKYVEPLLGSDLVKRLLDKVPGLGDLLKG
ncbi:MAG: DUF2780 domain-containing protein [Planctomycetota bacterium]|nr:DUF2780 domain-containing protein [Planctomycetota bacterium]